MCHNADFTYLCEACRKANLALDKISENDTLNNGTSLSDEYTKYLLWDASFLTPPKCQLRYCPKEMLTHFDICFLSTPCKIHPVEYERGVGGW